MSRNFGLMTLPSNLEVQYQGPLDARTVVSTFADLTSEETFKSTDGVNYAYKGLLVSVVEDTTFTSEQAVGYLNGLYLLLDDDNTDIENWARLVTASSDGLVDYRTGVTNYPSINGVAIDGDMVTEDFGFTFLTTQVVDELPAIADAARNVVYFTPVTDMEESDEYEEYMIKEVLTELTETEYDAEYPAADYPDQCYIEQYVDEFTGETMGPYIRTWERVGRAELNLTGYYTKEETDLLVTYFDTDADGNVVDGATDVDYYNENNEDAKKSYVTVGNIPAGTIMNGTQMQGLIEDLFYAVVDVEITDPSVEITFDPEELTLTTSGEEILVKPTIEIDYGTVTRDGVSLGDYAGTESISYTVGGSSAVLSDDGYLTVSSTGSSADIVVSVTLAAGQSLFKSDGSASEEPRFTGNSYSKTFSVTLVGTAYDCKGGTDTATLVLNECINVDEGYVQCELTATNDQVVKIATSFGTIAGVQQYNGFTRTYEYVGGSAEASLELYDVQSDDSSFYTVSYEGVTAGARTIRVIFS